MSFAADKAAAMLVIDAYDCDVAAIVDRRLVDYDALFGVCLLLLRYFECNPKLMDDFLACFQDSEMTSRGIYYNKITATITDGKFIAKCTISTSVTVTMPTPPTGLTDGVLSECVIAGASTVPLLIIDGIGYIGVLDISGGAVVDILQVNSGASVKKLWISGCGNVVSTVKVANTLLQPAVIEQVDGGYFGGYNCVDITDTCSDDVTSLTAVNVTDTSFAVTWTPAASTIRTIVYYRITNTGEWFIAGINNGDGVAGNYNTDGTIGYALRGLRPFTYYDVKVVNVCENGITSAGEIVTQVTS